jgi:hypothetical protein
MSIFMEPLTFSEKIFGSLLFFLPGFQASYFLFPRTTFTARLTFSVILSFFSALILGLLLNRFALLWPREIFLTLGTANLILLIVLLRKQKNLHCRTDPPDRFCGLLFILVLLGVAARLFFLGHIQHFGDGITSHIDYILAKNILTGGTTHFRIPFIYFYNGMLLDRINFVGDAILIRVFSVLSFEHAAWKSFLTLWMICGLGFLVAEAFTGSNWWALWGSAILAIGPMEIFHTTIDFSTPLPAYLALMALFLFYRKSERGNFYLALFLCIQLMFSYYSGALVMIISSLGFILAIIIRYHIDHKGQTQKTYKLFLQIIKQKQILSFLLIITILSVYLFVFSSKKISIFTKRNVRTLVRRAIVSKQYSGSTNIPRPIQPYKSRIRFLDLPVITWQDLFFVLLLASFWFDFYKKRGRSDRDVAYAFIPTVMQSLCLFGINMPERILSYLAFFAILSARVSPRVFKPFMIASLAALIPTTALVAAERIQFFHNSEGEIAAARWVKGHLKHFILGDERFMSLLVENGYYEVMGLPDSSPYIPLLFSSQNPVVAKQIFANLKTFYFASTKRMREQYLLFLNFPQEPMTNIAMYEEYFLKIFDNGDVKIFNMRKMLKPFPQNK